MNLLFNIIFIINNLKLINNQFIYDINCESKYAWQKSIRELFCRKNSYLCEKITNNPCTECAWQKCWSQMCQPSTNWTYSKELNKCVKNSVTYKSCNRQSILDDSLNLCVQNLTIKCPENTLIDYKSIVCYTKQLPCPLGFSFNKTINLCIDITTKRNQCSLKTNYNTTLNLCLSNPRSLNCTIDNKYNVTQNHFSSEIKFLCNNNDHGKRLICRPGTSWNKHFKKCITKPGYPSCPQNSVYNFTYQNCIRKSMNNSLLCPLNFQLNKITKLCTIKPVSIKCPQNTRMNTYLNVCLSKRQHLCTNKSYYNTEIEKCVKNISCSENTKLCLINTNYCLPHPCTIHNYNINNNNNEKTKGLKQIVSIYLSYI